MSEGLAAITIIGTIGRAPECKSVGSSQVLELSVAVNTRQKVGGERKEVAAWYKVAHWGKRAESLAGMLHKGERVAASGKLVPREYQKRDGSTGLSLDVDATTITLLGGKRSDGQRSQHTTSRAEDFPYPDGDGESDAMAGAGDDSDLPF